MLIQVHNGLANACLIFSLLIAGYSLLIFIRNQSLTPGFFGALVIAELLFLAQAIVGVILSFQGGEPARGWVHYLYGVVTIISLPGLYAITRGRDSRLEALYYFALSIFLAGIALRATETALVTLPGL
jgi:heme A synthase